MSQTGVSGNGVVDDGNNNELLIVMITVDERAENTYKSVMENNVRV